MFNDDEPVNRARASSADHIERRVKTQQTRQTELLDMERMRGSGSRRKVVSLRRGFSRTSALGCGSLLRRPDRPTSEADRP